MEYLGAFVGDSDISFGGDCPLALYRHGDDKRLFENWAVIVWFASTSSKGMRIGGLEWGGVDHVVNGNICDIVAFISDDLECHPMLHT